MVRELARKQRRFLQGEPSHFNLGEALQGKQTPDKGVHRVLRIDLFSSRCRHHEEWEAWLAPQEVVEELKGLRVAPLQIIGDEQQRCSRGEDGMSGGFEQTPSLLA